ncbi:MAG: hypothetical protein ACI9MB_002447, partial [Verrucomicrobiales bacterium]
MDFVNLPGYSGKLGGKARCAIRNCNGINLPQASIKTGASA